MDSVCSSEGLWRSRGPGAGAPWGGLYSRSSGDPHAAHVVAEAVRPQRGDVVLLDLHLVALEVGELVQADLVLQAVLQGGGGGGGEDQERRTGGSRRRGRYHADGPQRHEAVAAVRVAPGVPARILPLLQDEHLAAEVGLLEGNEAGEGGRPGAGEERELEGAVPRRLWGSGPGGVHLRAALHHHGAHAVQAALDHVHDLADDLHHAALEVLLVEHHDLHTGSPAPVNRAESDKQNRDDTGRDSLCRTPCRARRSWWPCWRRREPEGSCPWSRRRTWWSETW